MPLWRFVATNGLGVVQPTNGACADPQKGSCIFEGDVFVAKHVLALRKTCLVVNRGRFSRLRHKEDEARKLRVEKK